MQDGEAYTYLLNVLAPEHCSPATLDTKDPKERAKLILDHAERMDCKRYLSPNDIVEGSSNLNLAFVAQIFHQRWDISCLFFVMWCCAKLWRASNFIFLLVITDASLYTHIWKWVFPIKWTNAFRKCSLKIPRTFSLVVTSSALLTLWLFIYALHFLLGVTALWLEWLL